MTHPFLDAVERGDTSLVSALLTENPAFAGQNFVPENLHTDGYPLFHAAKNGHLEITRALLAAGADPNAALPNQPDPREIGMPLLNAFHQGHFEIVNLLLDHGATTNAFPYCSTPFVDCVYNATWPLPDYGRFVPGLIAHSFSRYFEPDEIPKPECSGAPETVQLLERAVGLGGMPTLFTVARHEHLPLIERLCRHCPGSPGTKMDWPQGTVFDNLVYGASWTGYPRVLALIKEICPQLYTADVSKAVIERAIRSHNRDGSIDDYFEMIRNELTSLQHSRQITRTYKDGSPFAPLHWLAEDFIEVSRYGFKCEILSGPSDQIRLAQLFLDFGVDVTSVNPLSGLTAAESARKQKHLEYADFLESSSHP